MKKGINHKNNIRSKEKRKYNAQEDTQIWVSSDTFAGKFLKKHVDRIEDIRQRLSDTLRNKNVPSCDIPHVIDKTLDRPLREPVSE